MLSFPKSKILYPQKASMYQKNFLTFSVSSVSKFSCSTWGVLSILHSRSSSYNLLLVLQICNWAKIYTSTSKFSILGSSLLMIPLPIIFWSLSILSWFKVCISLTSNRLRNDSLSLFYFNFYSCHFCYKYCYGLKLLNKNLHALLVSFILCLVFAIFDIS